MDTNTIKLLDFLNKNGYELRYISDDDILEITNLDLYGYKNIKSIQVGCFTVYGPSTDIDIDIDIIINLKDGYLYEKNYGFSDNFDSSCYRDYHDNPDEYTHDYIFNVVKLNNDLLDELSKFKRKGEYIKG